MALHIAERRSVALLIAGAVAVGAACGGDEGVGSLRETTTDGQLPAVTSTSTTRLENLPSTWIDWPRVPCDLNELLGMTQLVIHAEDVRLDLDEVVAFTEEFELATVESSGATLLASYSDFLTGIQLEPDPERWSRMALNPYGEFVTVDTFMERPAGGFVLFVTWMAEDADESSPDALQASLLHTVLAIGHLTDTGIEFFEPCDMWNSALEDVAETRLVRADAEFLARARRSPEIMTDLQVAVSGVNAESAWLGEEPARRSLRVGDIQEIPASQIADFIISGLAISAPDLEPGLLELRTDQGVITIVEVPGTFGIVPVARHPSSDKVEVVMTPPPGAPGRPDRLLGTFDATVLDGVLGAEVRVSAEGGVEARTLAPAELEERTGMTRDELESIRKEILAS